MWQKKTLVYVERGKRTDCSYSQEMNISSGKGSVTRDRQIDNSGSLFRAAQSTIYSGLKLPLYPSTKHYGISELFCLTHRSQTFWNARFFLKESVQRDINGSTREGNGQVSIFWVLVPTCPYDLFSSKIHDPRLGG